MFKKLQTEIKEAMIAKDNVRRDVLKMILNKAREIAKESKTEEISDEMVMDAAKKELKQLNQTISSLAGKEDSPLYIESKKKVAIIENGYLPKQMSEDELRTELKKFIDENKLEGKGAMRVIMPAFKNKADGKLINKIVSELL